MLTENVIVKKNWNTIVIGGGQAGLSTGRHLQLLKVDFIILDASDNIGDSWRNRWDSLKLFTPNWANTLPGYASPSSPKLHAGKDEAADFIASYAEKFDLPVLSQARVICLFKKNNGYEIESSKGIFRCMNVVIATGAHAFPKVPAFSKSIDPKIFQVHSSSYKRAAALPDGDILVAGAGTSGLQVAIDIAASGRKVYVSGNPPGKIPDFILKYFGKQFVWAANNILTIKTKPGRKAEYAIKTKGGAAPLINVSMKEAVKAGVVPVPRIKSVAGGYPVLEDDRKMEVAAVIWCTGFSTDFSWVNIPDVADDKGFPIAYRGVSNIHKGLYFAGMMFQYALTSSWIGGVGRDAGYVASHIHNNNL